MNDYEWQIHLREDFALTDTVVTIWRRVGNGRCEVITETNGQTATIAVLDAGVNAGGLGLRIPTEALAALAEKMKPGPSTGELAAIREALTLERRRVDDVLDAARERGRT